MNLQVAFTYPQDGWITLKIDYQDTIVDIHATSRFYNSLEKLVEGLIDIIQGDLRVRVSWATTLVTGKRFPISVQFSYVPLLNEEWGKLTIWKFANHDWGKDASIILAIEGTVDEIALPFWHALQQLQAARPVHEFSAAWGYPFPVEQMLAFTTLLEQRYENLSLSS